jgi:putative oxidoreductase
MKNLLSCHCFDKCRDLVPVILRLAAGLIFFFHGWQKLTEFGISGFAGALAGWGFPMASFFAYIVTGLELVGGAALILGLFAHWAGKLLAFEMLVAIFFVHLKNGLFVQNGGYELALAMFAMSAAVAMLGAGKWSLDTMMFSSKPDTAGRTAQGPMSSMRDGMA